jgi:DNA repair photolyase
MIPALTDHELEAILAAGREAGAVAASWIMLRLPGEVAELFREWLARHLSGPRRPRHGPRARAARRARLRPDWGKRMTGEGAFADLMRHRFAVAVKRLGLTTDLPPLRTDLFRVPPRAGDQLSLF